MTHEEEENAVRQLGDLIGYARLMEHARRLQPTESADEIAKLREALRLVRRAMKEECDYITEELDEPTDTGSVT